MRDFKEFLKGLLPWLRQLEESGASGFSFSKIVLKYVLNGTEAQDIDSFIQAVREYLSPALGDEPPTTMSIFQS